MALELPAAPDRYFDVLERVLDKGIVIDAAVQISLAGLEVLRIDAWVVVASFETYLRHDDLVRRIATGDSTRELLEPEL
jgi:hypothetical protein